MLDLSQMKPPDQHAMALDWAAMQARLQTAQGPEYWRRLEELAGSHALQELV